MITITEKPVLSYYLRDYQQNLADQITTEWQRGNRRVMCQLTTGGGKTVIFAAITDLFAAANTPVLVVAHREELIWQAKEKLETITGKPCGIIKAGVKPSPLFPIQIASIQSLVRRELPPAGLVVIDEAHHAAAASYLQVLDYYSEASVLGVTATPVRTDGRGFEDIFDVLLCGISTSELIAGGHLCNYKLFAAPNPIVLDKDIKTTGGDFDQQALAAAIDTKKIFGDLLEEWEKHALNKKTLVFAVSVDHSQQIAALYRNAGIAAEHLDGTTPRQEREDILRRFRTREILILCNCGIVSEGFDLPDIEVVQCVRPTKSLVFWLQLLGRALRPAPGKQYAVILDHTQNWIGHSLPDEERTWSLKGCEAKGSLLITCANCDHVYRPLSQTEPISYCPSCGHANVIELLGEDGKDDQRGGGRQVQLTEGELGEIDTSMNPEILDYLNQLEAEKNQKKYQPYWLYKKFIHRYPNPSVKELQHCSKLCGYKPGWAWHKWLEIQQQRKLALGTA